MRVTVTGATGLIGSGLIARLKARGDEVTVLSRNPERARESLGAGWEVVRWDPVEPLASVAPEVTAETVAGWARTGRARVPGLDPVG